MALWGHVKSYLREPMPFEDLLKRQMARRVDHVFAYTESGGAQAERYLGPGRVTVVQNSIQAPGASLAHDRGRAFDTIPAQREAARFLFLGGLDESKRIDFLVSAVSRLARSVPGFQLIVAGDGTHVNQLQRAASLGLPVKLVGRATGAEKLRLAEACSGILMPGRVGLVAVDALQLGLPLVTTRWPYHGPEADYLVDGRTAIFTEDTVESFVGTVQHLASSPRLRAEMASACLQDAARFSLEETVRRFESGILTVLAE